VKVSIFPAQTESRHANASRLMTVVAEVGDLGPPRLSVLQRSIHCYRPFAVQAAQLKLVAHLLEARSQGLNLLLLPSDGRFLLCYG
jgi:hypothetical protein